MLSLVYIIVFLFCISAAAASVILGHQLLMDYNNGWCRNYFYYLVTFFAFAFYGIWGPVILGSLMVNFNAGSKVVATIIGFLPILGIPFLFISWVMLIKVAYSIFGLNVKTQWLLLHGILFLGLIALVGALIEYYPLHPIFTQSHALHFQIIAVLFVEALYFMVFSFIAVSRIKKLRPAHSNTIYIFVLLMGLGMLMREGLVGVMLENPWISAISILLFFVSNLIPVVFIYRKADLLFKPLSTANTDKTKMERIFKKYQISRREKEIIAQICAGKTNQQISDELFISLQTVKDHTHRIYTKIGINSRMKLVQLVGGFSEINHT